MFFDNTTNQLPSFFMNSVPKSGTHLLKQILLGIPDVTHSPKNVFYEGKLKDNAEHFYKLGQLKDNEFAMGHVYYSDEWNYMLKRLGMKHVFLIRDPRDVVVSFAYFIVNKLPNHPLYEYFTEPDTTQKDRYMALIKGKKTKMMDYGNIKVWFGDFIGWLEVEDVYKVTFEELMVSEESRRTAIKKLAKFLWKDLKPPVSMKEMVQQMEANINPSRSMTFRKGEIGSWKGEFDEETIQAFKDVTGDLLIDLGYETDNNW
ncbi:MAG: sulfotransferase domain-containing protein [Bacillaceae bacterium]|nr:sulfotransferase domain-containing protein [Bacillaceae bacterium]